MAMTKQEFESKMTDVISYYGVQHFSRALIEEIHRSFAFFELDRFSDVIRVLYRETSYPPKLADFVKANETLRAEGIAHTKFSEAPVETYEPFFPDEAWIDDHMALALRGLPKADPYYVKKWMLTLTVVMKKNFEDANTLRSSEGVERYSVARKQWV